MTPLGNLDDLFAPTPSSAGADLCVGNLNGLFAAVPDAASEHSDFPAFPAPAATILPDSSSELLSSGPLGPVGLPGAPLHGHLAADNDEAPALSAPAALPVSEQLIQLRSAAALTLTPPTADPAPRSPSDKPEARNPDLTDVFAVPSSEAPSGLLKGALVDFLAPAPTDLWGAWDGAVALSSAPLEPPVQVPVHPEAPVDRLAGEPPALTIDLAAHWPAPSEPPTNQHLSSEALPSPPPEPPALAMHSPEEWAAPALPGPAEATYGAASVLTGAAIDLFAGPSGPSQPGLSAQESAELESLFARARRYNDPKLWVYVEQVLLFLQSDPSMEALVASLQLTRDHHLDAQQRRHLQETIAGLGDRTRIVIASPRDIDAVFDLVYDELIGLGPLGELWRDDATTEIMVDSWDRVSIERNGQLHHTPVRFHTLEKALSVARTMSSRIAERALSRDHPVVTAKLPGARAQFIYGSISSTGLTIVIRKFRPLIGMQALLDIGALSNDMAEFLRDCVLSRATILVSGGTGAGKTTALNALSEFIPDDQRVITIEDAFELVLANSHVVSWQTREAGNDDAKSDSRIVLADLLDAALRCRPDRIVVGEVREASGARVMLQAASTGHDGTMTTIHANNVRAALNFRLAIMLRSESVSDAAAKAQIADAFQLVVQISRRGGRRFFSQIAVVDPTMMVNDFIEPIVIFTADVEQGQVNFRRCGSVPADSVLAEKFYDTDVDVARWISS